MRWALHRLPYAGRDMAVLGPVDPLIVGRPALVSAQDEDSLAAPTAG
jgi:hypothetical protein